MSTSKEPHPVTYALFLRGINVGGHHKLPMSELKDELAQLGCSSVITILNSGNVIFEHQDRSKEHLEQSIANALKARFGFDVPSIVLPMYELINIYASEPFDSVEMTSDIRRYVTFSSAELTHTISAPWTSPDSSFRILTLAPHMIISVLDLAKNKTPAAMKMLEDIYGKEITTRNWNTIERIMKKL